MAKDTVEVVETDYSKMTANQLMEVIGKSYEAKDFPLMKKLLTLHGTAEKAEEKSKKDALLAELVQTTLDVKARVTACIDQMLEEGILDGAEGVWYVRDFGEKEEVGINPACRLVKTGKKASSGGTGASSYKAGLPPSEYMLKEVGEEVYFEDDTTVTIDKTEQVLEAGTTYRQAYAYSTNGGWRNRVRQALGRKTGRI